MQSGHIVTMIDACLERLQAARQLLSSLRDTPVVEDLLRSSAARTTKTTKKVRPAIATKKKRRDELTASLFDPPSVPVVTAPAPVLAEPIHRNPVVVAPVTAAVLPQPIASVPKVRTAEPRRRKPEAPVRGLAVNVPTGPVFIPASQVRKEVADKKTGSLAERTAKQADSMPLTAEMLAQRWIQSADL